MKKILVIAFIAFLAACAPAEEAPLRVGMDLQYPPFETIDGDNPEGISVDVAFALGEFLGREIEIVNTGFGALIPALNSGDIDIIIASMSIRADRAVSVDFSNPYFYFKTITLSNKDFADANGLTEDSTTEELFAIAEGRWAGILSQISERIPEERGLTVNAFLNQDLAVSSVVQGTSDLYLMSAFPVVNANRANPDTTIVIWDSLESLQIAMAVRKGDTELLAKANEFIAQMSDPGSTYDVLSAKYEAEVKSRLGRYGLEFFINE